MSVYDEPSVAEIQDALIASGNADGGWGYYPGHASRLEPTCWALLALEGTQYHFDSGHQRHRTFLREAQRADGLLLEPALRDEDRPNLGFNGLAALLLANDTNLDAHDVLDRLMVGLVAHRGIKLPQSPLSPQDNSLQAWSWIDSTFSWVEPTCWCLLALKKVAPQLPGARERIDEAERLLRDRCCDVGGWNAGTASVLGQGLRPFVPTTALGIVALQNLPTDAVVTRSVAELRLTHLSEKSAMALSLALIACALLDIDTTDLEQALLEQWRRTSFLGNAHLTAMALYSLTHADHGIAAFRI